MRINHYWIINPCDLHTAFKSILTKLVENGTAIKNALVNPMSIYAEKPAKMVIRAKEPQKGTVIIVLYINNDFMIISLISYIENILI